MRLGWADGAARPIHPLDTYASTVRIKRMAGEEGFEPSYAGIKIRCLNQLGDSPVVINLPSHKADADPTPAPRIRSSRTATGRAPPRLRPGSRTRRRGMLRSPSCALAGTVA